MYCLTYLQVISYIQNVRLVKTTFSKTCHKISTIVTGTTCNSFKRMMFC